MSFAIFKQRDSTNPIAEIAIQLTELSYFLPYGATSNWIVTHVYLNGAAVFYNANYSMFTESKLQYSSCISINFGNAVNANWKFLTYTSYKNTNDLSHYQILKTNIHCRMLIT